MDKTIKNELHTFRQRAFPIDLENTKQIGNLKLKQFWNIELEETLEIPIRYCEFSNIAFLENCPTKEVYQNIYTENFWKASGNGVQAKKMEKSAGRVKRIKRVLRKAKLTMPDQPNVLEIGCGHGFNLLRFSRRFGGKSYGIEPSKHCIDSCKQNNVELLGADIDDLQNNETPFDVVLMIHSLEHMIDPDKTVEKLGRLAKLGMILLVEVPDLETGTNIAVQHPFCYSARGLFLLLNRYGFKVLSFNSRKFDKRQATNLDVAAVYLGEKKVNQGDVIPATMPLEDLLKLQKTLQPKKTERWLRKLLFRYSITFHHLMRKLAYGSTRP